MYAEEGTTAGYHLSQLRTLDNQTSSHPVLMVSDQNEFTAALQGISRNLEGARTELDNGKNRQYAWLLMPMPNDGIVRSPHMQKMFNHQHKMSNGGMQ